MTNKVWWEKSVEYKFIADAVSNDWFSLLAPLAHDPEASLGDAVLKYSDKYVLIEFKKSYLYRSSEGNKYIGLADEIESADIDDAPPDKKQKVERLKGANLFERAKLEIANLKVDTEPFHLIIYGAEVEQNLEICAQQYWSGESIDDLGELFRTSTLGIDKTTFDIYAKELARLRGGITDESSSSSGGVIKVYGLSNTGDFIAEIQLTTYLRLKQELANKPEGP